VYCTLLISNVYVRSTGLQIDIKPNFSLYSPKRVTSLRRLFLRHSAKATQLPI